jgi:hypothetical protein
MARAFVIPPEPGWGPRQLLMTALEALGYATDLEGSGDWWVIRLA